MRASIDSRDWDVLAAAGGSPERLSWLKRQWNGADRVISPLHWVAGEAAAIDAVLGECFRRKLLSPFGFREGTASVVIGKNPTVALPSVGSWQTETVDFPSTGALVVTRVPAEHAGSCVAPLTAFGWFDRLVLVSRASQPLNQLERQILKQAANISAELRVLFLAYRGDEVSEVDEAELLKYAENQARIVGYANDRFSGISIFFLRSDAGQISGLAHPLQVLLPGSPATDDARSSYFRSQFARLVRKALDDLPKRTPASSLPPEERNDRLARFERHLNSLGSRLATFVKDGRLETTMQVRSFVTNEIGSWSNAASWEGAAMSSLENYAPGIVAGLSEQTDRALGNLDLRSQSKAVPEPVWKQNLPLIIACAGFGISAAVLWESLNQWWLRLIVAPLGGGAIAWYLYDRTKLILETQPEKEEETKSRLAGWEAFKAELMNWMRSQLQGSAKIDHRAALTLIHEKLTTD